MELTTRLKTSATRLCPRRLCLLSSAKPSSSLLTTWKPPCAANEIKIDRVEDARMELQEGQELEVKIINIDRKNRNIFVSIKAKDEAEERAAVEEHKAAEPERAATTLGDLIKAQMDQQD